MSHRRAKQIRKSFREDGHDLTDTNIRRAYRKAKDISRKSVQKDSAVVAE